jgi:hypothetical protein
VLFGIVMILVFLPSMVRFRGLVLQTTLGRDDPTPPEPGYRKWFRRGDDNDPVETVKPAEDEHVSLVGQRGRALSDLRPGGFARIGNKRVDVVTQGDYITEGDLIEVVADEHYRRVVALVEVADPEPDDDDTDATT